jgi:hypothetical protein
LKAWRGTRTPRSDYQEQIVHVHLVIAACGGDVSWARFFYPERGDRDGVGNAVPVVRVRMVKDDVGGVRYTEMSPSARSYRLSSDNGPINPFQACVLLKVPGKGPFTFGCIDREEVIVGFLPVKRIASDPQLAKRMRLGECQRGVSLIVAVFSRGVSHEDIAQAIESAGHLIDRKNRDAFPETRPAFAA